MSAGVRFAFASYELDPSKRRLTRSGEPVAISDRQLDVLALLDCLGPFLTADINFCPLFGLNVHGKRLYVVLDGFVVVTGLNQHERLITAAALAWFDWQARQTPSPVLSLTVDGVPATLGPHGFFDVAVVPSGPVHLLAATDAGDATAATVP